jgi:hypothetical protein
MRYVTDARVRAALAALCRDHSCRTIGCYTDRHPSRWEPAVVMRPDGDGCFTDAGAFEFIAKQIDEDRAIRIVNLQHPSGAEGYEIVVPLGSGIDLYVKLAFNRRHTGVIGRSFHYSER